MNAKLICLATTLVLASGATFAAAPMSVQRVSAYVDGVEQDLARSHFTGRLTREQVRAELLGAPAVPTYTDGVEYEGSHAMFMSRLSREEVRAKAALAARSAPAIDAFSAQGGRN